MLNLRNAVAGLGVLAATSLGAGAAVAAPLHGYVNTALHLRAGPGTGYPIVATMSAGDPVTIHGCLSGWSWCDINWDGYRGWAAGRYLEAVYRSHRRPIPAYGAYFDLPFLSFHIGPYWREHYRHRHFFDQMHRFEGRHHYAPPPRRHHRRPPQHHGRQQNGAPPFMAPPHGGRHHNGPPHHMGPPPHRSRNDHGAPPFMIPPHHGRNHNGPPHPATPPHRSRHHNGPPHHAVPPHRGRHHNGPPGHMGPPHRGRHNGPPRCKPGQHLVHGVCR